MKQTLRLPIRCYSSERAKYYQAKQESERKKSASLDRYKVGYVIMHPQFGSGKITEVVGDDARRYAVVAFKDMERRNLSLAWIDENCGRCV